MGNENCIAVSINLDPRIVAGTETAVGSKAESKWECKGGSRTSASVKKQGE